MNVLTTSNHSATLPKDTADGFFRVQSGATNTVVAFTALLNGTSEVPPVLNTTASAVALLSLDTTVSGGVLIPLATPSGTSGTISGTVSLDPTNLAYVLAGLAYVNIHSTTNGNGENLFYLITGQTYANIHSATYTGGEIRGQVLP